MSTDLDWDPKFVDAINTMIFKKKKKILCNFCDDKDDIIEL